MPVFSLALRAQPGLSLYHDSHTVKGDPPTRIMFDSPAGERTLEIYLDHAMLTLTCAAAEGVRHYLRLADSTLKPLPPLPEALAFSPGDAYIALTPGASKIADSPAIARFLHLRDYFNADKLAEALLAHLAELAGTDEFPEDVTVLVIEAR